MKNINKRIVNSLYPLLLVSFIVALLTGTGLTCYSSNHLNQGLFESNNIKFAQISDDHVDTTSTRRSKRLYAYSEILLRDAVKQINNISNIDFVVFSGDLVNRPNQANLYKFIEVANTLKAPWYFALGNHDIGILGGLNKTEYLNIMREKNHNFKSSKPYYTYIPKKGYLVVFMDGVIDSRITSNGRFDKEQLNWLKEQLKNNKDSKVIIVQHFPLIEPSKSDSHRVLNDKEYLDILSKYNNVLLVLSGHYHMNKITRVKNTIHVSTPALVQYPHAFRIISVNDKKDKIEVKFEFKETGLKDLQRESAAGSKSHTLEYGQEKDRNTTILVNK